jgi:hypothetical protein
MFGVERLVERGLMRTYMFAISGIFLGLTAAHAAPGCALMQKLAQEHSNSMAQRNTMDHAGFDERARRGTKAENVAYGASTKAEANGDVVGIALPRCEHAAAGLQGCCLRTLAFRSSILDDGNRKNRKRSREACRTSIALGAKKKERAGQFA